MPVSADDAQFQRGPRRKEKRYSYNESIDEPPHLLEDEPLDVEGANPAEENEPVEALEDAEDRIPPFFDEGAPDHDDPHR